MSEQLGLYAALAAAQAEYPEIPKRRTAKVKTKTQDGRWVEYSYKYADLSDIMSALRPALTKHGLSILHRTDALDNGKVRLTGILAHSSGQTVEAHMDMSAFPSEGKAVQTWGGNLTYARRYTLSALAGIASEDDDDANRTAAEGDFTVEEHTPRQTRQPQRQTNGRTLSPTEEVERAIGAKVTPINRPTEDADPWRLASLPAEDVADMMVEEIGKRSWAEGKAAVKHYLGRGLTLTEYEEGLISAALKKRHEDEKQQNLLAAG